jgi:hypothetical protein
VISWRHTGDIDRCVGTGRGLGGGIRKIKAIRWGAYYYSLVLNTYCCYAYRLYFLTCDMYKSSLRHIHDPVLSSLKMKGIRLFFIVRPRTFQTALVHSRLFYQNTTIMLCTPVITCVTITSLLGSPCVFQVHLLKTGWMARVRTPTGRLWGRTEPPIRWKLWVHPTTRKVNHFAHFSGRFITHACVFARLNDVAFEPNSPTTHGDSPWKDSCNKK